MSGNEYLQLLVSGPSTLTNNLYDIDNVINQHFQLPTRSKALAQNIKLPDLFQGSSIKRSVAKKVSVTTNKPIKNPRSRVQLIPTHRGRLCNVNEPVIQVYKGDFPSPVSRHRGRPKVNKPIDDFEIDHDNIKAMKR